MIGTTVGHYEVLEKLGEGGMGVVYKARDVLLNRTAALKFLPPDSAGADDKRRRFLQEAQAASALNHPGIVTIYEVAKSGDADFSNITGAMNNRNGQLILIAGPYRSGTGDDPARMHANVGLMEVYALPIFRAGHVPVLGEWFALPLVSLAGSRRVGDAAFNEIFHPIAERLLAHCDAVLRVGGASQGADLMVQLAQERGLKVYRRLGEIAGCEACPEPEA